MNPHVFSFLASANSQRRLAINLKTNRKTIVRKFLFLGQLADQFLKEDRKYFPPAKVVEFDDQETHEHTKLKPLSICMMTESKTRRILGFNVAVMPARGKFAARSRQKYGRRPDERIKLRNILFSELKSSVHPEALIKSDRHPHYEVSVQRHFPDATHKRYRSRKPADIGQGELKKGRNDPLFSINHTFGMYRANINRLFRKTWNTTKKKERLYLHVALYSLFHNWKLIPKKIRPSSPIHLLLPPVSSTA